MCFQSYLKCAWEVSARLISFEVNFHRVSWPWTCCKFPKLPKKDWLIQTGVYTFFDVNSFLIIVIIIMVSVSVSHTAALNYYTVVYMYTHMYFLISLDSQSDEQRRRSGHKRKDHHSKHRTHSSSSDRRHRKKESRKKEKKKKKGRRKSSSKPGVHNYGCIIIGACSNIVFVLLKIMFRCVNLYIYCTCTYRLYYRYMYMYSTCIHAVHCM